MKELTGLSNSFSKIAGEAKSLQERMGALYEDMGNILGRYYEIGEQVTEVEGDSKPETIITYTQNLLARDSAALRNYIREISPDIDLTSEIEIGGESVSVSIPLTVEFFWPQAIK